MKKKHLQPQTSAARYARVSSDRQNVDLSVVARLRALRTHAAQLGHVVARVYVDKVECGRVADCPEMRRMLAAVSRPPRPTKRYSYERRDSNGIFTYPWTLSLEHF